MGDILYEESAYNDYFELEILKIDFEKCLIYVKDKSITNKVVYNGVILNTYLLKQIILDKVILLYYLSREIN